MTRTQNQLKFKNRITDSTRKNLEKQKQNKQPSYDTNLGIIQQQIPKLVQLQWSVA